MPLAYIKTGSHVIVKVHHGEHFPGRKKKEILKLLFVVYKKNSKDPRKMFVKSKNPPVFLICVAVQIHKFHLTVNPSSTQTSVSSQFALFTNLKREGWLRGCTALILPFHTSQHEKGEANRRMWLLLIHSATSNEMNPVTVAHVHAIAWYGPIWQALKQNTLDVCVHVEEDAVEPLHSVTKFLSFCLPEEEKPVKKAALPPATIARHHFAAQRSRKANFKSLIRFLVTVSLTITSIMKSSWYKD